MKKYISVLKKSKIFHDINESQILSVLNCLNAIIKHYNKNEYVLRVGDSTSSIGILLSGSALIVQEDFWGNRNIRISIMPGQVFAESFACLGDVKMDVSVVANENIEVIWLDIQHILTTCPSSCSHHNKMIRNLLTNLAENNLRTNEKLLHITKRTTREKLLSYLSSEAQRNSSKQFDIPFNRQQLADYLSVDRSAMSFEISKMQKDGLIEVNKNKFKLNT